MRSMFVACRSEIDGTIIGKLSSQDVYMTGVWICFVSFVNSECRPRMTPTGFVGGAPRNSRTHFPTTSGGGDRPSCTTAHQTVGKRALVEVG